ncbi:probable inactive poly [ADP-ribose] polymerase SRO3 [Rhodamnia argentea]|uniref:Probable inactive poly [ADP-ribose] polymerase SRO3 n=1 Tax=Rhodamnia argentea TaxID=178133 RepID=A0A8B8PT21_9MYRT|nr:probable inactive poly [ADP-ribose] polymerase SRO3 [Rhodamnia argentea]
MASNAIKIRSGSSRGLVGSSRAGVARGSAPCRTPEVRGDHSGSVARLLVDNRHNFARSSSPARLMYYRGGSWLDFPSRVVESLKPSFEGRIPVVDSTVDGARYLFDFLRMLQIDFETGNSRSIAWIDENGKCFFPQNFVGEQFEDDVTAGDGLGENSLKRKREKIGVDGGKEEEQEVSSSDKREDVLKRPCLADVGKPSSRWPNARLLGEGDKAYSQIKNFFLSGLKNVDPSATITAIHQCTRTTPFERARYEVFMKQVDITRAARGVSNTVYAWHGTSAKGLSIILAHGFGVPIEVPEPESYGVGVHFSPVGLPQVCAMHSEADDNGEKHVVLCRVILGSVEKVDLGSNQSHPSNVDFDSGADDPDNPKHYVVWFGNVNTHVLPECIVSFKASNNVKGVKNSICELISKMKTALPPAKLQEVEKLYSIFRAGKLVKDSFVKQFRSITGDDVLLSAIREIRGSG